MSGTEKPLVFNSFVDTRVFIVERFCAQLVGGHEFQIFFYLIFRLKRNGENDMTGRNSPVKKHIHARIDQFYLFYFLTLVDSDDIFSKSRLNRFNVKTILFTYILLYRIYIYIYIRHTWTMGRCTSSFYNTRFM